METEIHGFPWVGCSLVNHQSSLWGRGNRSFEQTGAIPLGCAFLDSPPNREGAHEPLLKRCLDLALSSLLDRSRRPSLRRLRHLKADTERDDPLAGHPQIGCQIE